MNRPYLIVAALLAVTGICNAQPPRVLIQKALSQKNISRADSLLQNRLSYFYSNNLTDSLPGYLVLMARIEKEKTDPASAEVKVQQFMDRVKAMNPSVLTTASLYGEAAEFYTIIGKNELAYTTALNGYKLAASAPGVKTSFLASLDSDLGTYATRMGNISQGMHHHRKSIAVFLRAPDADHESLYVSLLNMGGQMWYASRLDSALYYYDLALQTLAKTERTPKNQYYRPAMLQNNLAGIYNSFGQTQKAIDAMKSSIANLKTYESIPEDIPKVPDVAAFRFEAIDNLGGIYKDLGDYTQAISLAEYSYQQKQKSGDADRTGIFKSQIILGQLYLNTKQYAKALNFLNEGLNNISKAGDDQLFWQADACYYLAVLHEEQRNPGLAAVYYDRADSLYEASMQGEYDDIYLHFLRDAALFHADHGEMKKALARANKGFNYVRKTQGPESLNTFYQLSTLADVYLRGGQYRQSLDYSNQGLAVVNKLIRNSEYLFDSVKMESNKPGLILIRAKANYALLTKKDSTTINPILRELNEAVAIIERKKTVIRDPKDISLLMGHQMGLLNFIKKLNLDLYQAGGGQSYIDQLMNLQESGTYSRIRARLDRSDSIRFVNIPVAEQEKEKKLKAAISESLGKTDSHNRNMDNYFRALEEWQKFQEHIRKEYPAYYRMRYEKIFTSLGDVQKSVPAGTTIIRYFFVDKDLFAVVLDGQTKKLVALEAKSIEDDIKTVSDFSAQEAALTVALHRLYGQLWQPLSAFVKNQRVLVIPDGILFNLSFEILTPTPIKKYQELATSSLLAKYTFAYHYSLALVGPREKKDVGEKNFVAFAPGFMDQQKKSYAASVKDSLLLDRSYITLLPQPFSVDLVSRAKEIFGGKAFTNNSSTAAAFRSNAGGHKIIHIGTHAESNNLSPEFSRLIFSKARADEQNSVYLHEIYNCDLRSELAVLTACESGRPGYQDGEGMISLAHAFNYAGSESMITGLWKIDEQASTILMDAFYAFLRKGMAKDEALRQAKLKYLETTKGRMLAPQYWAGLVLMGDTSPVVIEPSRNIHTWWLVAGAALALGVAGIFIFRRKKI